MNSTNKFPYRLECPEDVLRRSHAIVTDAAAAITTQTVSPDRDHITLTKRHAEMLAAAQTHVTASGYYYRTLRSLNENDLEELQSLISRLSFSSTKLVINCEHIIITSKKGGAEYSMELPRSGVVSALWIIVYVSRLGEIL
jgi:hypothetical protein